MREKENGRGRHLVDGATVRPLSTETSSFVGRQKYLCGRRPKIAGVGALTSLGYELYKWGWRSGSNAAAFSTPSRLSYPLTLARLNSCSAACSRSLTSPPITGRHFPPNTREARELWFIQAVMIDSRDRREIENGEIEARSTCSSSFEITQEVKFIILKYLLEKLRDRRLISRCSGPSESA